MNVFLKIFFYMGKGNPQIYSFNFFIGIYNLVKHCWQSFCHLNRNIVFRKCIYTTDVFFHRMKRKTNTNIVWVFSKGRKFKLIKFSWVEISWLFSITGKQIRIQKLPGQYERKGSSDSVPVLCPGFTRSNINASRETVSFSSWCLKKSFKNQI